MSAEAEWLRQEKKNNRREAESARTQKRTHVIFRRKYEQNLCTKLQKIKEKELFKFLV